jgi:hypothetical protein
MSVDQLLSLFIPRVFPNITQERVAEIFHRLGLGDVRRVDRISKSDANGNEYYSIYVHFNHWNETLAVANFQERVLNPDKEARIVYGDPWYWIVLENKGQKRTQNPAIVFDDPVKKRVAWAQAQAQTQTQVEAQAHTQNIEESWDLVDATYAEYYEIQLAEERARVEHLECMLWNMEQELLNQQRENALLNAQLLALQKEAQTTLVV